MEQVEQVDDRWVEQVDDRWVEQVGAGGGQVGGEGTVVTPVYRKSIFTSARRVPALCHLH